MFDRVMVVTDFSPNSLRALAPTIFLARSSCATVFLCHVDEEEQALSAYSSDDLVTFLHRVESKRAEWLEAIANEIREHEVACEIVRLRGWASKEIIRFATDHSIDITAISALGGQGFKSLLMGSTSANVLRNLQRPTLFISARCNPAEDFAVKTVLFPTDFSAISLRGAAFAARLCRALGARLELYHVMKIPSFIPALPGEPPLVLPTALLRKMEVRFDDLLAAMAELLTPDQVSCEVATGDDEAELICSAAIAKKADLIVIPKRGHGVLEELVFGRVAENVARLAPIPTLLFQPDEV